MAFAIDRGIPFPPVKKSEAGRPTLYPFAGLAVGDSFFVPSKKEHFSHERSLAASLHRARTVTGFNLQWIHEHDPDGYRIWRVEGHANRRRGRPPGTGSSRKRQ